MTADGVDFSDRLNRRKRYYQSRARRRRRNADFDGEEEEDQDEEDDETLEQRLARLRAELEEVKADLEDGEEGEEFKEAQEHADGNGTDPTAEVGMLSDMLDAVYGQRGGVHGAEAQLSTSIQRFSQKQSPDGQRAGEIPQPPSATGPPSSSSHVLVKAAEFDTRLASLEKALGLSGSNMPDAGDAAPSRPILLTLQNLDRDVSALSTTGNTASLDTLSKRIRQLTQEAERLSDLRKAQSIDAPSASTNGLQNGTGTTTPKSSDDQSSKIKALYSTLPIIQSLSPTLPLVLERLRTLRLIHTAAGNAAATLEEVERRQAEQEAEIKQWQEALEKVERALVDGEGVMKGNVETVGAWVRELEARVAKL